MLDKKTKTVLAVAAVAGVGYYLWMQSKKSAAPKAFANFMSVDEDEFALVEAPNSNCAEGYTTKRPNGTYLCCNPQYWGKTAKDQECTLGRPTKSSM